MASLMELTMDVDKLSYEIFSLLESRFLFGYDDHHALPPIATSGAAGKVRILSIDAGGGLLAAAALVRLESLLRKLSGEPTARIADFFDVAAGSGQGGVLAALLFTSGVDGRPLFSADQALRFLTNNRPSKKGIFGGIFRRGSGGRLYNAFGGATLRDTVKPVLVPCHNLATGGAFMFSRADAVEADAYDFLIRDVCAATCAAKPRDVRSVDGRTRVAAIGGDGNPAAAAITHVLNNKREFPLASGVDDLIVVSLGGGAGDAARCSPRLCMAEIAGIAAADVVDQAVAMAFGKNRAGNYVRIQDNGLGCDGAAEAVLSQRSVESVMFEGKKLTEETNGERLERFAVELVKEQQRRMRSETPAVVRIKPTASPPRSSSATTLTTTSVMTSSSSSSL